jgi:hypothetical protein
MFYDSNHAQNAIPVIPSSHPRDAATVYSRLSSPMRPRRPPPTALRGLFALALSGSLLLAPPPLRAGPPEAAASALERSVKAAFLYKFLGYAEFPPAAFSDAAAPVVIGVLGADELAAELTRIVAGRTVNQRPVVVKALREGEAASGMHLLFIGGEEGGKVKAVLKALNPEPMLVVTEAETGLQNGSVINFKIVEQRVRFDVSLESADKHGVKLSSRLLTVANQVVKGGP